MWQPDNSNSNTFTNAPDSYMYPKCQPQTLKLPVSQLHTFLHRTKNNKIKDTHTLKGFLQHTQGKSLHNGIY